MKKINGALSCLVFLLIFPCLCFADWAEEQVIPEPTIDLSATDEGAGLPTRVATTANPAAERTTASSGY